jgi:hypothetical protein
MATGITTLISPRAHRRFDQMSMYHIAWRI